MSSTVASPNNGMSIKKRDSTKGNSKKDRISNTKKTLFVGTGLGLCQNEKLDAQLQAVCNKSSTRHMLQEILGDREDLDESRKDVIS